MLFFTFDLFAEVGSAVAAPPIQRIPSVSKPAVSTVAPKDMLPQPREVAQLYFPKLMESHAVAEDGFPIANARFEFSQNELQNLNKIDFVKSVLKREQRKLTRKYFEKNILFNHMPPAVLEKFVLETSQTIDDAIDEHTEFNALNYFSFDTYRAHLFRVGMFKVYQVQTQGLLSAKFSVNNLIPKTPFEIIAMISLLLNLIVLGYFVKSKYS